MPKPCSLLRPLLKLENKALWVTLSSSDHMLVKGKPKKNADLDELGH